MVHRPQKKTGPSSALPGNFLAAPGPGENALGLSSAPVKIRTGQEDQARQGARGRLSEEIHDHPGLSRGPGQPGPQGKGRLAIPGEYLPAPPGFVLRIEPLRHHPGIIFKLEGIVATEEFPRAEDDLP
jgi:hypothetical protein